MLYQIIVDIKRPEDAKKFMREMLKKVELKMLIKRLAVVYFLNSGSNYEDIKKRLAVSSATISSFAGKTKKGGFSFTLGAIKVDEWAEKLLNKFDKIGKLVQIRKI